MIEGRNLQKTVTTVAVTHAYRFAIDPTPRQRRALASHCGAARVAYNWGLHLVRQRLDQRRDDLSVPVPWTLPELRREWNRAKQQVAPWWAENSKEAYGSGLDGLATALKNFSDSKHGRRQGHQMGFPHEKLARRLEQGTARILAATITRTADRWHVSFTVEVQRTIHADNGTRGVIGVDVGVRHLAVLSSGAVIPNPRALERSRRRLRRLNRELHRRRPQSRRRRQTRRRLARVHARAANLRCDALHKLTTALATEHGTIVVEQLNLAGMVRNRRLARALSDAGLAELRRQLTYKTCSACGRVKAKLTLAERTFACEMCGLHLDRDLNAARNLAGLVQITEQMVVAGSGPETRNACVRDCQSTGHGGRSGNPDIPRVGRQQEASSHQA